MTSDWDEPEEEREEEGEEAGLVGGGGPAATIYGTDDEADEHGDNLAHADEDEA